MFSEKLNLDNGDDEFNCIYPAQIQQLAIRHFTPIAVAKMAADFLVPFPKAKVLDIGSGAGKFCFVGALSTKGIFTGIEQREKLVHLSNEIALQHGISNAQFIQGNITEIDFSEYDSFYFYNSFQENIEKAAKMDSSLETDPKYYGMYSDYVSYALSNQKTGTRLVTYWSSLDEVPSEFEIQFTAFDERLKFWKKIK
jgi:SAM-dependent methyltransferase